MRKQGKGDGAIGRKQGENTHIRFSFELSFSHSMKTIEEAMNAVHKLMYQRTVLNVLITDSLCKRLSVELMRKCDP